LNWVWNAFSELNYRRSVGFNGPLPITVVDIEAYCSLLGIHWITERERLLIYLRNLDQRWMKIQYEKKAPDTPQTDIPDKALTAPGRRNFPRK